MTTTAWRTPTRRQVEAIAADRDRLQMRIDGLAAAVHTAELGGASVIPIAAVLAHLNLRSAWDSEATNRRTAHR